MSGSSIDGLISGMDTTTIVSQLMQIEAQSQTRLQIQVNSETSVVSAYQAINAALKTATDKAKLLDAPTDWNIYSATSSSANVAASAAPSAIPGTYAFDVTALAKPHTVLYGTAAAKATIVADPTIALTVGTNPAVSIAVGDGSLQAVADAINARSDLGVRAGLIKVTEAIGTTTPATYRLQLTSASTGVASQFSVAGLTGVGTAATTSTGQDAEIKFGPLAGDVATSKTNTFTDVFPGVTFTVSKVEVGTNQDAVKVTVGADNTALQNNIKGIVDSVNAVLSEITKDTAYNASTKTGGPLLGQLLASQLQSGLRDAVIGTTSLAAAGIQLDQSGKVTLDASKLAAAMKADPVSIQDLVTGFAARVVDFAGKASAIDGNVSSVIKGRQTQIKNLNDRIADWDVRLALREAALKKQYSGLEVALGALKSQGDWLTGQINSLPTSASYA